MRRTAPDHAHVLDVESRSRGCDRVEDHTESGQQGNNRNGSGRRSLASRVVPVADLALEESHLSFGLGVSDMDPRSHSRRPIAAVELIETPGLEVP